MARSSANKRRRSSDWNISARAASAPPTYREKRAAVASRRLAVLAARTAAADKSEDIVVLDVRGLSPVCDFLVIASGTSDRQMRAVAANIEEAARATGDSPFRVSGLVEGTWIVLDFVDVVVHLFDPEHRRYYDLEMLWGDALKVDWEKRLTRTRTNALSPTRD